MSDNRTYFTLRTGKIPKETILSDVNGNPVEFASFAEAYDKMCREYMNSLNASYSNPSGLPVRYAIWRTQITNGNSMTQPVWYE